MVLKCLPTGMFESNCYILGDNGEGIIIDAGVNASDVKKIVEEEGLKIKYILLTHGHIDHICAVDELREITGAQVLIHEKDAAYLVDPVYNGSALYMEALDFKPADGFLKEGENIQVGNIIVEVLHTPGHTTGGVCLKVGNKVFTGDTLFERSIGRTDFRNGSYPDIIKSILGKLMKLDDEFIVYPGHGRATTIGNERKNNPFLKG